MAIEQSADKICNHLSAELSRHLSAAALSDRLAHEADRLELEARTAQRGRMAREADLKP